MDGEIISIRPKEQVLRHRSIQYTIQFTPSTRKWRWSFDLVTSTTFAGSQDTLNEAIHAARLHIDLATGAST
jgi:hypothetical protein